ncbi:expressed unknown protein [Seminavis robusta]|uniref:Uncharacterized protein n=1 Tax=Seminavis robusta TaxID=568900 RepID=A0A9N8EPY6_9STRA|nr:expressed unknown protein [Seminavis robusta]|eukprot:Sro1481_g276240.1 n/a (246) ;mRNA; f:16274-17011
MAAAVESIVASPEDFPSTASLEIQYHRIEVDEDTPATADDNIHHDPMRTPLAKRRRLCSATDENPFDLRSSSLPSRKVSLVGIRSDSEEYTEGLKYHHQRQEHGCASYDGSKKQRVNFRDKVHVREIPSHRDCCPTVRKLVWNSLREIQTNAARNELEFYADCNDWRQAKEEDQFCLWHDETTQSSALVHPVTFEKLQRERQFVLLQLGIHHNEQEPRGFKRTNEGSPLRRIAKVSSFQDLSKQR